MQQHCFIRTPIDRGISPPRDDRNKEQDSSEPEEPASDLHFHLPALGGRSRIQNEFEILKWLGKGAFGDVFKVRNKLDGGVYAIKRIELNPKNRQLNRKITREVKLLSRLNHENVVRYYNSWIESATLDDPARHSNHTPAATPSTRTDRFENVHVNTKMTKTFYLRAIKDKFLNIIEYKKLKKKEKNSLTINRARRE